MSAALEVDGLSVSYGGLLAVADVSLRVEVGQLVGLIGPNGAGKTSLIDAITGFASSSGALRFDGQDISRMPTHRRARLGLARTWQSVELFDDLTVREHVLVAYEACGKSRTRGLFTRASASHEEVELALDAVGLSEFADRSTGELSHGQRKLVGIARAIAGRPKVILLDEPAAGLDSNESELLGVQFRRLLDQGFGLLLIEHDVQMVATICDYLYALDFGRLIAEGSCHDVLREPVVQAAYLGAEGATAGDRAIAALEARA